MGAPVPESDSVTAAGEGTTGPGGPSGVAVGDMVGVGFGAGVELLDELQAAMTAAKARASSSAT